jgi:SNF2 family DNA or RNA helicase
VLVSTKHKVLLLDRSHDDWIVPVIPHAIAHNGYRVIPHQIDETIILRNLGFNPPSPIEYDYAWPGRFVPFKHQRTTSAFLTLNPRAFVLNDIGTGKTLSAYWAADYLMLHRKLRRVLVVSPLSTLDRVHGDAIFQNFIHRNFAILHGTASTRRRLFQHAFDFYIVNYEGLAAISETYKENGRMVSKLLRDDIDLILIDEFAAYRNGQTQRWKLLKRLVQPSQWVWGMSGEPTPNEPTDAYSEVKLINPAKVERYPSFRSFQTETMHQINQYRWKAKDNATDAVHAIMQPAIRFTRDECLDLPPCLYETRTVELSAAQQKTYKELAKEMVAMVKGGKVTALNEGVLMMRLVQVASGVAYDVAHNHLEIDCGPRLAALEEIIEEANTKVIVFVPFIGNITFLEKALGKRWRTATVYGDTSHHSRSEIFRLFQGERDPKILVAHPGCMSHGLTLTEASTIVWWAPVTSNETYEQANGRINRPGQRNNMLVVHLTATKIERAIYKRLEEKQKLQGLLLEMVADSK